MDETTQSAHPSIPHPPPPITTDTPTSNASTLWQERNIQDHVVVAQAESEFGRVQRSLSTPKAPIRVVSHGPDSTDLERCHDEDRQETFDLREYLTSSNDANSAAGIKHKHVGVTWEDLEVSGIGSEQSKVRNFIRHPRVFVSRFVFLRSTSLPMQVKDLVHFIHVFLLTFWGRRSHRTHYLPLCCSSQPTPTDPPNETAKAATRSKDYSQVGLPRGQYSSFLLIFFPGTPGSCGRARWSSCSVLQDRDAPPSSRSSPTSVAHTPT